MDFALNSFATFLTILWFLVYWILGGVFFAVVALLRLGRVRKVRFSCLFTIWVLAVAIGVAFKGLEYSQDAIAECVSDVVTRAEMVSAIFGCGFVGVFGAFLIGALAVTVGGFLIFAISRTRSKPWIVLEEDEGDGTTGSPRLQPWQEKKEEGKTGEPKSKFF
jgi:hypothetical protein